MSEKTRFVQPTISTYAEMETAVTSLERKKVNAIVWVIACDRRTPDGTLIETVFYCAHSSQGFSGALDRTPNAPVYWFPWGQPYEFTFIIQEDTE